MFSRCRTEPCEDTQQLQGLWSSTSNVQGHQEKKKASTRSESNDESAGLTSTSLGLQGGSEVFMSLRGHLDLPGKTAPHTCRDTSQRLVPLLLGLYVHQVTATVFFVPEDENENLFFFK